MPEWLRELWDTVTIYEGRELFGEIVLTDVTNEELELRQLPTR